MSGPVAPSRAGRVVNVLGVVGLAVLSISALEKEQLAYFLGTDWTGFPEVLRHTGIAALRVWTFWAVAGTILAGLLLRTDPTLGRLDALIGGFAGVWIFAYVGGNLLGPIGLFRSWTVWVLLAFGAWSLWQRPPQWTWPSPTPGQRLLLLVAVLALPTMLLLQLGSPVPPYMDIFATPAAAQRIMTFGWYRPFDSDPYGFWDAGSQLPGLELFYALLGFGSGTSLGLLADTAAIVPMTALLMLATYRLGRGMAGDVAGGFASVFLVGTILPRVMPYMHGRSTAFVLAAIGMAFVLDDRRTAMRTTLGALALATAFASHAAVGALAMAVTTLGISCWLLGGNLRPFLGGTAVMIGTVLLAFPTVAVCTRMVLPYPVLPLVQLLGLGLTIVAARWMHGRTVVDRAAWVHWLVMLAVAYLLLRHTPWFPNNYDERLGGAGFVLALWPWVRSWLPRAPRRAAGIRRVAIADAAFGLAVAIPIMTYYAAYDWKAAFPDPRVQVAIQSFQAKVDYWIPYVLVFPAGYLAAWLYRRTSPRLTVALVLLLVMFPWREKWWVPVSPGFADPNYHQHSLSEAWAYQLENGKRGWWGATPDRRWAQNPEEREASEVLLAEVAAGRITMDTSVAHLGPYTYLYKDNFLFTVYTGINGGCYITN
jgi:hypothetical protein